MKTIVALHAHPDDEVLLTGGTIAAAAAAGHRVILVTATSGEAGLSNRSAATLRAAREDELRRSAEVLGCAGVVLLGHPDSGLDAGHRDGYAHLPVADLAAELRDVLEMHGAEVLLSYDRNGGYGHPDHLQVHRVGRYVASQLESVRLVEATVNRAALLRALRLARFAGLNPASLPTDSLELAFTDPRDISLRAHVGRFAAVKRRAMLMHRTQAVGGESQRMLDFFARLPRPLFRMVFGTEWFVEPRPTAESPLPEILRRFGPGAVRQPSRLGPAISSSARRR